MKICSLCKTEKSLSDFGKHSVCADGLNSRCRICINIQTGAYYHLNKAKCLKNKERYYRDNKDRLKQKAKQWAEENPDKRKELSRIKEMRRRARKRNSSMIEKIGPQIVFDRDQGICGICKTPVASDSFHIDHIIPLSKGGEHSYANVQLAHPQCNAAKGAK